MNHGTGRPMRMSKMLEPIDDETREEFAAASGAYACCSGAGAASIAKGITATSLSVTP